MAVSRIYFVAVFAALVFSMIALPAAVQAQSSAPAPAPTSDAGTSIDHGIAYVLMLLALVLTYLIHTADFCFSF